jgi:ribosomal protein S12 methylthiotransferase accessory factor
MAKHVDVTFPGGKRVDAEIGGHVVHTDQSEKNGGDGSAAEPFDLFFVSIATCVGIYALEFCSARDIPTDGLAVALDADRVEDSKLFSPIRISVTLPNDFPAKYVKAMERTVNMCTVKKHIVNAPEFEVAIEQ